MNTDVIFTLYTAFWVFTTQWFVEHIQQVIGTNKLLFVSCALLFLCIGLAFFVEGNPLSLEHNAAGWVRYVFFPAFILGGNGLYRFVCDRRAR